MSAPDNAYLGEVLQQQQKVEMELYKRRAGPGPAPAPAAAPLRSAMHKAPSAPTGAEKLVPLEEAGTDRAIDCRVTGWWLWKTVVVPPNVYVVHTRRGRSEPLHIGMGVSFRFNPRTDAFLVIPAVMQTIVINARCICVERQGILVQAYLQWIIDDVATAYRKLDFSDTDDPVRIVNVQLREQAEAAIKDKVATMHIDDVLADKQPIIEELTHRLRLVAEGSRDHAPGSGLGLKIVTVQIKEAVVSSTSLWQNLQRPFRVEREKVARMAELETERQIAERELQIRQTRESAEMAAQQELERQQALKERAELLERNATEKAKYEAELDLALKSMEIGRRKLDAELQAVAERKRLESAEAELARLRTEHQNALAELTSASAAVVARQQLEELKGRRAVENDVSEGSLKAQMITALPAIADKLPVPNELKSVQISGDSSGAASLVGLVEGLLAVVQRHDRSPQKTT